MKWDCETAAFLHRPRSPAAANRLGRQSRPAGQSGRGGGNRAYKFILTILVLSHEEKQKEDQANQDMNHRAKRKVSVAND